MDRKTWVVTWLAFLLGLGAIASDEPFGQEEIARLRKENAALKSENQRLRRMLAGPEDLKEGAPHITPQPAPTKAARAAEQKVEGPAPAFWLSNSGKRHNPNCRYFQTSAGHPCGVSDGVPCKVCGG